MKKTTPCKACGNQKAKSARTCPHCGAKPLGDRIAGLLLLLIIGGIVIIIGANKINGSYDKHNARLEAINNPPEDFEDTIYRQVIDQSLESYRIAERSGNKIDQFTHAGIVAEAYLQAGDETNYAAWVRKRDRLSEDLGMSLPE